MSQGYVRWAAVAAAALLCFVVGMLGGVEAAGGQISSILLVRTQTVIAPARTTVRTVTATPVTSTVVVTRKARHGHQGHHGHNQQG